MKSCYFFIITLINILLISSCCREQQCEAGRIDSIPYAQYQENDTISYKSDQGNEILFLVNHKHRTPEGEALCKNYNGSCDCQCEIETALYVTNTDNTNPIDGIYYLTRQNFLTSINLSNLNIVLDEREYTIKNGAMASDVTLNGTLYESLIVSDSVVISNSAVTKLYYDLKKGVVAFKDSTNEMFYLNP